MINMKPIGKNIAGQYIDGANAALNSDNLDESDLRAALQLMKDGEDNLAPKAAPKEKKQEVKQFKSADICRKAYLNYITHL